MNEIYTDKRGRQWRTPTEEELLPGTPLREAVEEELESWAPNYQREDGRITSYDDWLERVEGLEFPDQPGVLMELGNVTDAPPYTTLKRIAKQVAKELS